MTRNLTFKDRAEAGRLLAAELQAYSHLEDVLVLALPRGGVPVGDEVARALKASLDVLLVRKLGVPGQEELAMGAIAADGIRVLNETIIRQARIDDATIDRVAQKEQIELDRRNQLYRGDRPPVRVADRVVIVVDDGIATGATMKAIVKLLRQMKAGRIVVAVPVAPPDSIRALETMADDVVTVMRPSNFAGVGQWFDDFSQTTDREVCYLLKTHEIA